MPSDAAPNAEIFAAILRNQGIPLDDERLDTTLAVHVAFRPALEQMRRLELPYLDPIEPGHVFQWIEGGGTIAHSSAGGA